MSNSRCGHTKELPFKLKKAGFLDLDLTAFRVADLRDLSGD
jgi:hypothetical protein